MFTVEILHNKDCHTWKILRAELKRWIKNWGLSNKIKLKVTIIATDVEARERRFSGSPQLLINGKDVDPAAGKTKNYHADGCRIYVWNGAVYEYPPKEMAEKAILELGESYTNGRK